MITVAELRRRLARLPADARVLVNDQPYGSVEVIDTDDGPAVILWSVAPDDGDVPDIFAEDA